LRLARSPRGTGKTALPPALRRTASGLIVFALGVSLLGACPCTLTAATACPAMPDHTGRPASCCDEPAPTSAVHSECCCGGPEKGDLRGVAPTLEPQGHGPIPNLVSGVSAPVPASSLTMDGVWRRPPARHGGPPVLRI
jgi:hypothetical protein